MNLKDAPSIVLSDESAVSSSSIPSAQSSTQYWHRISLGLIALLSAFLSLSQIQLNGYGNLYYAAAVRSMLESWHNFFFVSFDPGGFVMVDKPPLGLWLQAASAKLLGFSGFSMDLPQILAGIASVLLLYYLVRRTFGPVAGLLAALFLAITPINVVMMRSNNLDMLLTLVLLLSAWATIRATETGKLSWLLLGALFLGLGFNIKTFDAYLVLPALGLLYLLGAAIPRRKRIWHLVVATLFMVIISFAWIAIVDLTPALQRPYVGSSQTNSELELTLGYNGIARLLVGLVSIGGGKGAAGALPTGGFGSLVSLLLDNGSIGPTRFFTVALGGQVSWLLPMAIVSLFVLGWQTRFRIPLTGPHRDFVLWGMWLLTMGIFFSIASLFHAYYLVVFSPALCALSAIGIVLMWHAYCERSLRDWRSWSLIVALILTAAEQIYLLSSYQSLGHTLSLIIGVLCLLVVTALIIAHVLPASRQPREGMQKAVPMMHYAMPLRRKIQLSLFSIGMVALLLTPFIWSYISTTQPANTIIPTAGPALASNELGSDITANSDFFSGHINTSHAKLINYLVAHAGTTRYLVATPNALIASDIIIQTGRPVMALGGFVGMDSILTQQRLISLIHNNMVRFFLASETPTTSEQIEALKGVSQALPGFRLTTWVTEHCTAVPQSEWSTSQRSKKSSLLNSFVESGQLYDCAIMH